LFIHIENTVPPGFPSEKSLQESGMWREKSCKLRAAAAVRCVKRCKKDAGG